MPRIQGVDLPNPKPTYIALTYLYGIGRAKAIELCFALEIDPARKAGELDRKSVV